MKTKESNKKVIYYIICVLSLISPNDHPDHNLSDFYYGYILIKLSSFFQLFRLLVRIKYSMNICLVCYVLFLILFPDMHSFSPRCSIFSNLIKYTNWLEFLKPVSN